MWILEPLVDSLATDPASPSVPREHGGRFDWFVLDSVVTRSLTVVGGAAVVGGGASVCVNVGYQNPAVDDVVRAFRGRIWVALAYDTWAEWCECELGGLKLPVPQRREIVAELSGAGMSNPAIADAIGVDQSTVYRDKEASGFASAKPVTGQDGKEYSPPRPKPYAPQAVEPETGPQQEAETAICSSPGMRGAPAPGDVGLF